jgi:hypothetical protein
MWGGTAKPGDGRRKAAVHSGPAEGRNRRIRILRRVELRRPEPAVDLPTRVPSVMPDVMDSVSRSGQACPSAQDERPPGWPPGSPVGSPVGSPCRGITLPHTAGLRGRFAPLKIRLFPPSAADRLPV